MGSLFTLTVVAGLMDSFNPFGIVQQFALQGLLKERVKIWYYIGAIFATNFAAGIVFYTAIVYLHQQVLSKYWLVLERPLGLVSVMAALAFAWYGIRSFLINWQARKNILVRAEKEAQDLEGKLAGRELTTGTLISIGFLTTIMELTTAAPYFAYLTLARQHQLTFPLLLAVLFGYNLLYCAPFFLLYFLSVCFKDAFNQIYIRLNRLLQLLSAFLMPVVLLVLAVFLAVFGIGAI